MKAEELLVKVNDFLDNLKYDRKPSGLYDPVKYVLSMGGKRIRPVLMLLSYGLFKDDVESVLMPACALETYHNYTLLHDDLMDNADMRRGHETVHRKWDANTAILSGDSMLVLAYERMAKCNPVYLSDVLHTFTETALEIGEGQQYDMEFETRNDVTEDEYIEMIRLKTSVLLACAQKIGAILAGARSRIRTISINLASRLDWLFSFRTIILMFMVTRKSLERKSEETSSAIRKPTCSSMLTTELMPNSGVNCSIGWKQRRSTAMRKWLL